MELAWEDTMAGEQHHPTGTDSQLIVDRRRVRPIGSERCAWCNGLSKGGYLYRFESQRGIHGGLFCSKSCHDAQHGESRGR
jgi:hypothetical protein